MNKAIAEKIEAKEELQEEPWRPASILSLSEEFSNLLAEQGLKPKWKRKDDLDRARLEGWEPYSVPNPDMAAKAKTLIDGASIGTTIEKRNLILCVMPLKRVEARAKYFKNLTDIGIQDSVNKFKQETDMSSEGYGNRAYGEIKIKVGEEG